MCRFEDGGGILLKIGSGITKFSNFQIIKPECRKFTETGPFSKPLRRRKCFLI